MKRIVAAVGAVALVVAALVIRSRIDENERRGPYRLTCATELTDACRSIEGVNVTGEPAGVTADALLADAKPAFEGWLAPGQWTTSEPSTVLAHTRVAVAIWRDRAAALRRACGNLNAKCLGDAAGRGTWAANRGEAAWGPVKFGFADPATEAAGLAAIVAGAAGVTGSLDLVPAQLDANDAFLTWLDSMGRARVTVGLPAMLAAGPAVADAYLGLESEIAPLLERAARRTEIEIVYVASVDVEARLASASGARRAPDGLSESLMANGWRAAAEAGHQSPSAAAWAGIRRLWKDTVR